MKYHNQIFVTKGSIPMDKLNTQELTRLLTFLDLFSVVPVINVTLIEFFNLTP